MSRNVLRCGTILATFACGSFGAPSAWAVDTGQINGKPIRLDVTNTTVVEQNFDARQSEGEAFGDYGWGTWLNRLNLILNWDRWAVGTRLDSSLYWRRPIDRSDIPPGEEPQIARDNASRYRNAIYPAKVWVTYSAPGLEVTAGDAYVQFGRGLVLSMRKIDDLGIDTTLRGAKLAWEKDPFALTLVAGIANPSRVDEASGRALFLPEALPTDPKSPQPVFGSDRIIGAEIQAGRGLPVTLSTQAARLTRCAPYPYDPTGRIIDNGIFSDPIGSCLPSDNAAWLSTLPSASPNVVDSEAENVSQSIEIPNLGGHGNIYVEGALQRRHYDSGADAGIAEGNALYASATLNTGIVTSTVEVKSYRNFYPLGAAVDTARAPEFSVLAYSAPPTTELITQDSMFGYYNTCVDGGRFRSDVRLNPSLLVYGALIYAYTKSEDPGGTCDKYGHTISGTMPAASVQATVWDGLTGFEWQFDHNHSQVFFSAGVRDNPRNDGVLLYREAHFEYTITKYISGPYSIELTGQHRQRKEEDQNIRSGNVEQPWFEGQHYTALKVAPKWVFSQGFEYKTLVGFPTYYVNGSILYKFTSDSSIRLFVGQQRGGLRCVNGICRIFPDFEGARLDLTLRF